MKKIILALLVVIIAGCEGKAPNEPTSNLSNEIKLRNEDLANARWLLGNWESEQSDKPFYQRFTMTSDSSLKLVEVVEMGDFIHHVTSNLTWQDNQYYFGRGDTKSYKVIRLRTDEIFMMPNKEINSIHWQLLTDSTFKAEYQYPQDTQRFLMKRSTIDPDSAFALSHHDEKHRLKY